MRTGRRARASYIVKVRRRVTWTTRTVKGPRRVRRWGPWERLDELFNDRRARNGMFDTLHEAWVLVGRPRPDEEAAVFLRGKRVEHRASKCETCARVYSYAQEG